MDASKNPKHYWKAVKQNCNRKSDLNNQICASDWLTYFKSLFTSINENQSENVLRNIVQNHDSGDLEIILSLQNIHANRSPGPDGICIEMLKVTRHEILPYLITLFNDISNSGTFPTDWCKGILCPVYNKKSYNILKRDNGWYC